MANVNDTMAKATAKYVRITPSKVNRVLATIRGKKYVEAAAKLFQILLVLVF